MPRATAAGVVGRVPVMKRAANMSSIVFGSPSIHLGASMDSDLLAAVDAEIKEDERPERSARLPRPRKAKLFEGEHEYK